MFPDYIIGVDDPKSKEEYQRQEKREKKLKKERHL